MGKTNLLLNARQLFLLFCIKKCVNIEATNTTEYSWTFLHEQEYWEKTKTFRAQNHREPNPTEEDLIKKEILPLFPTYPSEKRFFKLHQGDFGPELANCIEPEITWYSPGASTSNDNWEYKELFEVADPISENEISILREFANFKEN
jgi:hypothetical protein